MNTLVSSTTTHKPPSNTWETFAVKTSLFSKASSNLLLPFSAARRLYVKRTCPSPSFTFNTFASIVSPTETIVVRSALDSFVYSLRVMIPSDLYPIFKTISSGFTSITVPSTTSPFLIVLNDSSNICSKLISDILLNLLNNIVWGRCPCGNTYVIGGF